MNAHMKRFGQIEGLRGLLAVWVALSHMIGYSGAFVPAWTAQWLVNGGTHAVHVFMIVSGFVITHLVIEGQEAYGPYLIRRFFRLFPAFAIVCLLGWATQDLFIVGINARGNPVLSALYTDRAAEVALHPLRHIIAHATLFHGLLPEQVLPMADGSFIGTGWAGQFHSNGSSTSWRRWSSSPCERCAARRSSLRWPFFFGY